jgi:hypothetical protein
MHQNNRRFHAAINNPAEHRRVEAEQGREEAQDARSRWLVLLFAMMGVLLVVVVWIATNRKSEAAPLPVVSPTTPVPFNTPTDKPNNGVNVNGHHNVTGDHNKTHNGNVNHTTVINTTVIINKPVVSPTSPKADPPPATVTVTKVTKVVAKPRTVCDDHMDEHKKTVAKWVSTPFAD